MAYGGESNGCAPCEAAAASSVVSDAGTEPGFGIVGWSLSLLLAWALGSAWR